LSRYLELAKRLDQQARLQVVFFGTRAEERLIAQVGTMFGAKAAVFFGLELREFVALLSRCRLVVCNNSGPLHIATALGVPTVSTMGPTDPIRWWPEGDEHLVVRKPLWCSPCEEGVCPLGTHDCLMSISVDEMLAAVSEQLTGRPLALPAVVSIRGNP
jgi:heptosyltransferase-2